MVFAEPPALGEFNRKSAVLSSSPSCSFWKAEFSKIRASSFSLVMNFSIIHHVHMICDWLAIILGPMGCDGDGDDDGAGCDNSSNSNS